MYLAYLICQVIISVFAFDSCIDLVNLNKMSSCLAVRVELDTPLPVQVDSQLATIIV